MSAAWNAAKYLRFERARLQPALDLISRIQPSREVREIVDLGCGSGNALPHLATRFPGAAVVGIDSSATMLAQGREALQGSPFSWALEEGDFGDFSRPCDVLFSNAALHWRPRDHAALIPRLLACVRPGGVLAVQMPDAREQTSHLVVARCAREVAGARAEAVRMALVEHGPEWYYDLLAAAGAEAVDVWRTEYVQPLAGDSAVADYVHSTTMRPFLDAFGGEDSELGRAFLARARAELRRAYPPRPSGVTLFPFRRVFFTARAPAAAGES